MRLKFQLRKDRVREGYAPLRLRITVGTERAYMNTGLRIRPKEWNDARERVTPRTTDARLINQHLDELRAKTMAALNRLVALGRPITAQAIKYELEPSRVSFDDYAQELQADYQARGQFSSARSMRFARRWVQAALGEVHLEFLTARQVRRLQTVYDRTGPGHQLGQPGRLWPAPGLPAPPPGPARHR